MESLKDHALPIISGLLALNAFGYGALWRSLNRSVQDNAQEIKNINRMHYECQKILPEKFASLSLIKELSRKLDDIAEKLAVFPMTYRTKEEANKDWRILEQRMAEISSKIESSSQISQDGINKLWDKLNRIVDEFRNSRNMVMARQAKIEEKVYTSLEKIETERLVRELDQTGNHLSFEDK